MKLSGDQKDKLKEVGKEVGLSLLARLKVWVVNKVQAYKAKKAAEGK